MQIPNAPNLLKIIFSLALVPLIGCGSELQPNKLGLDFIETTNRTSTTKSIIDGNIDHSTTNVFAVYIVNDLVSYSVCTGSLISPNVILTARHCIAPTTYHDNVQCSGPQQSRFEDPYPASTIYISNETNIISEFLWFQNVFNLVNVDEIIVPSDASFCGNDIALLVLKNNSVTKNVQFLIPRVDEQLRSGETYDIVGYGKTSSNSQDSGQRRRKNNLNILCSGLDCNASNVIKVNEWRGQTSACFGDSGGPALDHLGRVIGVTSRVATKTCRSLISVDVFKWGDWLSQYVRDAANQANLPTPDWAQGLPTENEDTSQNDIPPSNCQHFDYLQLLSLASSAFLFRRKKWLASFQRNLR